MHIKRIEIIGFKSFVDKVTLDLEEGVTGIVGPNGCGKSNIVDAIRWAMGEQNAKHLRGRGMEDVIFGGSESRKPLGMAEVSLIFSNEEGRGPAAFRDYAEIMITRRLYRDGESDYLINKTPCRLLDITEFFMDTGVGSRAYAIIEQGKIGMILNAKPEDRRFLIEEAAGVTKFKSRKKAALRKIDATQQNLLRINDIVGEVRRQLGGLKRQAQKAERFREYREELKGIELAFARRRQAELNAAMQALQREELDLSRGLEGLGAELARHEAEMEELRLRQVVAEKEVSQAQEQLYHFTAEIRKVEDRHAFSGREIDAQQVQIEHLLQEENETVQRLTACEEEEETVKAGGVILLQELAAAERRLAEGQSALDELQGGVQDATAQLEESRTRLYGLLTELSRLGSQQEDARRRLGMVDERVARNRHDAVMLREQLEEARSNGTVQEGALQGAKARRSELQLEREELTRRIQQLKGEIEQNEHALLAAREGLARQRSRLESLQRLEQDLEGYGGGVKTILREPALAQRFQGMLADRLDIPAELEVAVEAVLGERLQALIAADPAAARDALDLLKERGGRSTLLLPPVGASAAPPKFSAGLALADLIPPQPVVAEIVSRLLGGVFLVESLDPYLEGDALPTGVLLATRRGETLSWRGELNGGSNAGLSEGLLHKKREIKELITTVAAQEGAVAALAQEREERRRLLQQAESGLVELGTLLQQQELKIVNIDKELLRFLHDTGRFSERLEVLSLEEEQLHEERQGVESLFGEADRGRTAKEAEKSVLEGVVAELQEAVTLRRRDLDTVRESLTGVRVDAAGLKERAEGNRGQIERLARLRQELNGRRSLLQHRAAEAQETIARLTAEQQRMAIELEVLVRRREEEQLRFDRIREKYDAMTQGGEGREEALKVVRNRIGEGREALAAKQLKLRECEIELRHLCDTVLERFRVDLAEVAADAAPFEPEAAARRQNFLRRAIEEIGEVNLMAIEEYRELDERYQFLTRQQEDLKLSLEGLQTAITKINRTTRKRFRETFDLVNEKFCEIFPRLFRGGRAELRLTDEEDLLETGIDIIVQPPGKKLQNVGLLSGGEKALTAVALIFSIFLVKPSPFCLLDEVDAPLDEANIGRFNEMVREMCAISQFVIITHSRRTMEIADTLYGVTMEEPGVSKLVSVRLNT